MKATAADPNSECVRVVEVDLGRKLTATELDYVEPLCSQGHPPSAIAQGLESAFIKALRVDYPDLDPDELKLAKKQFRKGMRVKRVKELIEEGRRTYGW